MATSSIFSRLDVNARRLLRVLAFTIAGLFPWLTPSAAKAERVLVLRPLGEAPEAQRAVVEQAMQSALDALSFEVVLEAATTRPEERVAPESANDFRALGELMRCEYVLASRVTFVEGGYRVRLEVGYAPRTRAEPLDFEVRAVREHDRWVDVFRAVLRPEGSGDAATRFAVRDQAAIAIEAEQADARAAEEARRQAEQAARGEAEAQAAREAEEAQATREAEEARQREEFEARERAHAAEEAASAWNRRERYGRPQRMMALGGFGLGGILNPPSGARGGMIAEIEGRFGYSFPDIPGFELRGGLDIVFGATAGLALTGGAVYLVSPWQDAPVHVGGGLEVGIHQALSGNRVPQMMLRAEGIVSWHAAEKVWLEAAVPMLTVLTANGGVMTAGFSLRAGTRF